MTKHYPSGGGERQSQPALSLRAKWAAPDPPADTLRRRTDILVTGGAGFIGSHFVRTALADALPGLDGARVTVLDKLTYAGNFANLGPVARNERLDFIPGDVCDAALVDTVVPGHDAIVHFAAESHVDRSITAAADFAGTNVVGTQVLLDAALRHGTARRRSDTVRWYREHEDWWRPLVID